MSFYDDIQQTPAANNPPVTTAAAPQFSGGSDPRTALTNLSTVQSRMDSLHKFLSDSVNANTPLGQSQIDVVSSEISSAIHQIIVNGAALLSSCNPPLPLSYQGPNPDKSADPKVEIQLNVELDDYETIEMDAVELLAEHIHFCEICGKGFKRDANLRMHMRAHGNPFKTREALAKPEQNDVGLVRPRRPSTETARFSCPYVGCNRNKQHEKFRPLKNAICAKNHFKRSHCPKMYYCDRCSEKSFSVMADLKSHMKHCGERKLMCSCGTGFSRKDDLFRHMGLFEGHMPAVVDEVVAAPAAAAVVVDEEEGEEINVRGELNSGSGAFEGLIDGFDLVDDYCFREVLKSPNFVNNLGFGMEEGFFEF